MRVKDCIKLVEDKPGFSKWESWVYENKDLDLHDALNRACDAGLEWLCNVLNLQSSWEEYWRIKRSARAERDRVMNFARVEYGRVMNFAWAEHDRVVNLAWAEYDRVVNPAWAELVTRIIDTLSSLR